MLKLYDYFRSSAAFRVRLALNFKQLTYEKIKVNLLSGEQLGLGYSELNPAKLVPLLVTPDGEKIHQSLAIMSYLDEAYPESSLLPHGISARAYVRALALDIACDVHPLNNLRVLKYLKSEMSHSEDEVQHWYHHWIGLGLTALHDSIQNSPFYTGTFCCGADFTLADACLLPQLVNARRLNGDVTRYPLLLQIEAHCLQYEWVKQAYPEEPA